MKSLRSFSKVQWLDRLLITFLFGFDAPLVQSNSYYFGITQKKKKKKKARRKKGKKKKVLVSRRPQFQWGRPNGRTSYWHLVATGLQLAVLCLLCYPSPGTSPPVSRKMEPLLFNPTPRSAKLYYAVLRCASIRIMSIRILLNSHNAQLV